MDEDEFKRILGAPTDEDLAAGLTLIPQRIRQEVVPTVTVEALYAPTVRLDAASLAASQGSSSYSNAHSRHPWVRGKYKPRRIGRGSRDRMARA